MKTRKKILIGLMALCLAGSIGSALALVTKGLSNQNIGSSSADQAIYLHFDNSSVFTKLDDLGAGSQFRYVRVSAPSKSSTVTGNYSVTFSLVPEDNEKTLAGVTCNIYRGVTATTYVSARDAQQDANKTASTITNTLSGGDATVTQVYNVSVASAEDFYLEFTYVKDTNNSKTLGGSMMISLGMAV